MLSFKIILFSHNACFFFLYKKSLGNYYCLFLFFSHLDSATTDLKQLLDAILDILMEGDEDESTTADSYASLIEKKKVAFNNLSGGEAFITLRRDNIGDELLKK